MRGAVRLRPVVSGGLGGALAHDWRMEGSTLQSGDDRTPHASPPTIQSDVFGYSVGATLALLTLPRAHFL